MDPIFTSQQLKNIIDLIPACIYWKSLEGHILGCNRALIDVYGKRSLDEVLGRTEHEILTEPFMHFADAFRKNDMYVVNNLEETVVEEIGPTAKGYETRYLSKKIPLMGTRNQVCGIIGVSIDLGETSKGMRRDILDKYLEIMPTLTRF